MEAFREIDPIVQFLGKNRKKGIIIGLVPTMGALHEGHLELIKRSAAENNLTICSIFVNPTQFNNQEDFINYPKTIDKDLEMLMASGCDVVFIPEEVSIYPKHRLVNLDFGYLENIMEGVYRPNHFKGVGLIVTKLFNIIQPDNAYFGKKDLQQLTIVNKLVEELNFKIKIHGVDTVRNERGLALSSRNQRLSESEKIEALIFYHSLDHARKLLLNGASVTNVKNEVYHRFDKSSTAKLEYFEIVHSDTLKPVKRINDKSNVSLCIAGFIGKVRLIDNISLI